MRWTIFHPGKFFRLSDVAVENLLDDSRTMMVVEDEVVAEMYIQRKLAVSSARPTMLNRL